MLTFAAITTTCCPILIGNHLSLFNTLTMIFQLRNLFCSSVMGLSILWLSSCNGMKEPAEQTSSLPTIFPDYSGVTIPLNIAPLNFMMENADHVQARFLVDGKEMLAVAGEDGVVDVPESDWHQLLGQVAGKTMQVEVAAWDGRHPDGVRYQPFSLEVSKDSIDPWIAYRLIEPGYEPWRYMGIYERNLSDFEEIEVVSNKETKNACINCHHFDRRSAKRMMFHARGANGGTIFLENGHVKKVDPKSMEPFKGAVYPAWHPEGRYIAFSSNMTQQSFFGQGRQALEVYDKGSDLLIYDTKENKMVTDERFLNEDAMETFPAWSPDGKWLYFCSSPAKKLPDERKEVHYSILRVAFDGKTGVLGEQVDTVYNARTAHASASFPRISPDGRYLLFTKAANATFPIWHPEADLKMLDLMTGKQVDIDRINDPRQADSYHSWSANGRWVMWGSRRLDGRYTRVFFAHFDKNGKMSKPFLLPQKDPRQNTLRLKSFNIPEFVDGKIEMPKEVVKLFACPDE